MNLQFGLNIVTLVMCIITLMMATAALMPQIKLGLVILRDGLLWTLLLGILGFVGVVGWTRLHEARQQTESEPGYGASELQVPDIPAPELKTLSPQNSGPRVPEFQTPSYDPNRRRTVRTSLLTSGSSPSIAQYQNETSSKVRPNRSTRRIQSASWTLRDERVQ